MSVTHVPQQQRICFWFAIAACICISGTSHAQARVLGPLVGSADVKSFDKETTVFLSHIEVRLPPSNVMMKSGKSDTRGFYAWKFSFGEDRQLTIVLRSDSAVSASNDRAIVRASKLYRCQHSEQLIYDCNMAIPASVRLGSGGVVVDITDTKVVAEIRSKRPSLLFRQAIEPGGRFLVDETRIKYLDGAGR